MYKKTKLMLGIQTMFIFLLFILPPLKVVSVSTTVVVSDHFDATTVDDLHDWTLQGYKLQSSLAPIAHGFILDQGRLTAPSDPTYGDGYSRAYHASNVSYGSWSFDWTPSSTQQTYDGFEFLLKDYASQPYNLTGRSFPAIDHYAGYGLTIGTFASTVGLELALVKFYNSSIPMKPQILDQYSSNSSMADTHKVKILRDSTGNFTVLFDSVQRIQVTDNTYTTSEVFTFVSFQGNSSIDNVEIDSFASGGSAPFADFQTIMFTVIFLTLLVMLKRKKKV